MRRTWRYALPLAWVLAAVLVLMLGPGCSWLPTPQPPVPPDPPPDPPPAWQCEIELPWCHEVDPPMTCGDCVHNPSTEPEHCEKAPDCPEPPPEPPPDPPEPPDPPVPPIPTDCTIGTPTALELVAQGKRALVRPEIHGRNVGATPLGEFGRDYYCSAAVAWPEACAAGRSFGPVAPEGHPQRLVCEQYFLQGCGPLISMEECTGSGNECPITFDPFYVINGVNQNHPDNVIAGCLGHDWEKVDGHVVKGSFWIASAHGRGKIKACDSSGSVCTASNFEIDN